MLASALVFTVLVLAFCGVLYTLYKRRILSIQSLNRGNGKSIYLPPAKITGMCCLLLLAGASFGAASLTQLQWPFNFYSTYFYITLGAFLFSLCIIAYALYLYYIREHIVQLQFTDTGVWVADLQPANRRYLFLDLLHNRKFAFIAYTHICRAELRETFAAPKIVLITTTGSTPLAFFAEDKQDAVDVIQTINDKATGIDVMHGL
jgi:hypothetical protein